MRHERGFTLIELMIVVVVIAILVAIAIPNFIDMRNRAFEGSTKANMHTFQLAAEECAVDNDGAYPSLASDVAANVPLSFSNPFDGTSGDQHAWKDQATFSVSMGTGSSIKGIVAYADSVNVRYCIAGHGAKALLPLHLLSGS